VLGGDAVDHGGAQLVRLGVIGRGWLLGHAPSFVAVWGEPR
jgi:hypothetical protein